jgi:hypothetical protein
LSLSKLSGSILGREEEEKKDEGKRIGYSRQGLILVAG